MTLLIALACLCFCACVTNSGKIPDKEKEEIDVSDINQVQAKNDGLDEEVAN